MSRFAALALLLASACGGSKSATSPTTAAPTISSVAVSTSGVFVSIGQSAQFSATASLSNGTTLDVTSSATWQSSDTSVLTVSATGLATSIKEGDAQITATSSGVAGSVDVRVRIRWQIKGRFVSAADGTPFTGGTTISMPSANLVTGDSHGNFTLEGPGAGGTKAITISGPNIVTRTTQLTANGVRTGVDISLITLASPFSLTFYREFLRGLADNPSSVPIPSFRWETAPSFYIRTTNGSSEMPAGVIDELRTVLPAIVAEVSGGRFTVTRIETGSADRPITPGWINVEYTQSISSCGLAAVGGNRIQINPICSNLGSVAAHETTHAMGFWHHNTAGGLMSRIAPTTGTPHLSTLEAYHTNIVYSRPRLNTDPDNDPVGATPLAVRTEAAPLACWAIR